MSFINDQWNPGLKKMTYKCIEHIMKQNQLLHKDLWKPSKIKFTNRWDQFQKMFIFTN